MIPINNKKANSCFTAAMDYIDSNDYGHRFGDDSEQLNCKNLPDGSDDTGYRYRSNALH